MGLARDEIANATKGKGCLGKAKPDEPVFILRAQDRFAPHLVRTWAYFLKILGRSNSAKYEGALQLASEMETWADQNGSKIPD